MEYEFDHDNILIKYQAAMNEVDTVEAFDEDGNQLPDSEMYWNLAQADYDGNHWEEVDHEAIQADARYDARGE